ncbi:MAG: uroporphyrinogen-III synthase [Inquilinaceae bacterium]
MARFLVTRPAEDAAVTIALLAEKGHEGIAAPLLRIEPVADAAADLADSLADAQALMFTSANGVRAFAALSPRRDLPVLTVGAASAAAARAVGFARVESADGAIDDLVRLARSRCDPAAGVLVHGGGAHVAGDLGRALAADGFAVRRAILYRAVAVDRLPDPAATALADGGLDGILFFSPRTAEVFARLARSAHLAGRLSSVRALCISDAVIPHLDTLGWARIEVAARPDAGALVALTDTPATDTPSASPPPRPGTTPEPIMASDPHPPNDPTARESAAARIIARFGGIRPMATKLGAPVTTVQGWKKRGSIPAGRHAEIRTAAQAHGVVIDETELLAADSLSNQSQPQDPPVTDNTATPAPPPSSAGGSVPTSGKIQGGKTQGDKIQDGKTQDGKTQGDKVQGGDAPSGRAEPARTEPTRSAEKAEPKPAPPPPPSNRDRGKGGSGAAIAWLALVIAVLGTAAALTRPYWATEYLGSPSLIALTDRVVALENAQPGDDTAILNRMDQVADSIDGLNGQVETLAARVETLEAAPGAGAGEAALTQRLDALEADIADLPRLTQADVAAGIAAEIRPLADRIDALAAMTDEIDRLQTALNQATGRLDTLAASVDAARSDLDETRDGLERTQAGLARLQSSTVASEALVLAVGQLRLAVADGAPYGPALDVVRSLIDGDPALADAVESLAAVSERGVPSRATLRARFPAMARAVRAAAVPEDADWVDRTLSSVQGLVSVRPTAGEVEGTGIDAILARAEFRLGNADLTGAVTALDDLDGPAAAAAGPWLSDARARLTVDGSVDRLSTAAIAALAGESRQEPAPDAGGDGAAGPDDAAAGTEGTTP